LMLWIVCYKQYIQTVSLLNDFACVLLDCFYLYNICHILCTCIYFCEYSYADANCVVWKNVSRIHHMYAVSLCCGSCGAC